MRRALAVIALLAARRPGVVRPRRGRSYRFDPKGRVKGVRAADVDGRRPTRPRRCSSSGAAADGASETDVVVLKAPGDAGPRARGSSPPTAVRIPCDGPAAGVRATAGALAVGRFGATGPVRLRFLGAEGALDLDADGKPLDAARPRARPSSAAAPAPPSCSGTRVADLDGDGRDECLVPDASGSLVAAGLLHGVENEARQSPTDLVAPQGVRAHPARRRRRRRRAPRAAPPRRHPRS